MRIFFIFEKFSKNRKNWSFRPPRTWGTFLAQFTHVPIFYPNEWILEYEDFLHFRKLFKKSKKLKFSPSTEVGNFFGSIHKFAHFPFKWVNLYILVFLEWEYEDFLHFRKLFKKLKKLKFPPPPPPPPPPDLGNFFGSIHSCAHFPSKWVILYILVVLEWEYEDFLPFLKLFKILKKLKFSPTADLGTFFWFNSHMGTFFIQMSECLYFSLSWNESMMIFFIFENFLKKKSKKLKFSPTADLGTFLAQFTHGHIFRPNEWMFIFFIVLEWKYDDFLHFRKFSKKK